MRNELVYVCILGTAIVAGIFGNHFGVETQKHTITVHDNYPTIGSYCRADYAKVPTFWKHGATDCASLHEFKDAQNFLLTPMIFRVELPDGTASEFSSWYDAVEWTNAQPMNR